MSDRDARSHAAHSFDENVVVVAGAGTGKTSLLVERVLCQMVARDLAVDGFAAITFTEKAAAEMRRRLADELSRLRSYATGRCEVDREEQRHAADRAYLWLVDRLPSARIAEIAELRLRDLVRAEVTTIHAFCAGLLRRHPIEAGVSPGFSVDTGLGFEDLQRELWRDFLSGADGPGGERAALWARTLGWLDLAEVERLALGCATFAISDRVRARGLAEPRAILAPVADFWLRQIGRCLSGSPAKGPESWLDAARAPLEALRDEGIDAFRTALALALHERTRGDPENLLDRAPPTSKSSPEAQKLAARLQGFFLKFRGVEDERIADALALVRPYAEAVRRVARQRGVLPFDALLALAADLLRANPGIRRALAERYRVLFVDEFQDTDPLQYEIVFQLSEDPESSCLRPGSLFIVGDPKQAIYRFRGADIGAYGAAVARVVGESGGSLRKLTTNFRAPPELLEPLNPLLESVLAAPASESESDRAIAYPEYDALVSGRKPMKRSCVEIWRLGTDEQAQHAGDARDAEARVIAAWVAAEIAAARLRPGQVAVLFRALSDVHRYALALHDRGVPCLIGRSEDPEKQPAGQQLLALLRALHNPADSPAVLGVLRSPLGAVPDAELARWAGRFEGVERRSCWSYPDVDPPEGELPNLARGFRTLRALRERAHSASLEALLAALVEATPLLAIHRGASDGSRRVADLWTLVDRLVAVAQADPSRELADLIRDLESEARRSNAEQGDDDTDAVRLSTIHGVKGLEFPVVILPDLERGKGGGGRDRPVKVEILREAQALAVSTRGGISASWLARERAEELHENAQIARVFYVACTRARERLIFVHAPRGRAAPPEAFVHYLDRAKGLEVRSVPVPEPAERRAPAAPLLPSPDAIERAERVAAQARARAGAPFARPSGLREDAEARLLETDLEPEAPRPLDAEGNRLGRAIGSALHEALERWDFADAARLRELVASAARRVACDESLDAERVTREAAEVAAVVIGSDLPAHFAGANLLGRELPVLYRDPAGTAWNGTIDLLYRDPDGRLVVADYKSDSAPDAAARSHYRAQLSTYARGLAQVFPGEPEPALELVWLRSGKRERLRLESQS